MKRTYDADGPGAGAATSIYWSYEGDSINPSLEFSGSAMSNLSHRYLWGPAVDQLFADEQVTSLTTAGNTLWALSDHLGTINDIADLSGSTTTITNHRRYNAFGSLTSESNAAVDMAFQHTGKYFDEITGLQLNLNRWFDSRLGQWISEDPIGFAGGDENLRRYVGNGVVGRVDPDGLTVFQVGYAFDLTIPLINPGPIFIIIPFFGPIIAPIMGVVLGITGCVPGVHIGGDYSFFIDHNFSIAVGPTFGIGPSVGAFAGYGPIATVYLNPIVTVADLDGWGFTGGLNFGFPIPTPFGVMNGIGINKNINDVRSAKTFAGYSLALPVWGNSAGWDLHMHPTHTWLAKPIDIVEFSLDFFRNPPAALRKFLAWIKRA